jgi:glutaredoxin-related protein
VKGEFVGGCDIIREMHANNELESVFRQHGVTFAAA